MNRIASIAVLGAASGLASADLIASDNFDSAVNLLGYSAIDAEGNDPTNTGVWSSSSDNFGVRSVADFLGTSGTGNFVSDTIIDDSIARPGDFGIIDINYDNNFFAVVDTDNGVNPSGVVTGTWTFDISNAASLDSFSVDLGAVGGWFDNGSVAEQFTFAYSIDGGSSQELFTIKGDQSVSGTHTYADGGTTFYPGGDPSDGNAAGINGQFVSNDLTTYSAAMAGSGSVLTITLTGFINDNGAGFAFDNMRIDGTLVPRRTSNGTFDRRTRHRATPR